MSGFIRIPVIYYHSVGPVNNSWNRNYLTLDLKYFEKQIQLIANNFQAISLQEFWEARNGLNEIPKNAIVITFDDGFLDNWVWAFPYLKKYGLKATIFVNPEFVDKKGGLRPQADLGKPIKDQLGELNSLGYLSWEEMRVMEMSGLIDIQSHTMTHTKYFVSDKLAGLHHPGADTLYPIGNKYIMRKPYYITDYSFEKLLPYGYPLFESTSAIVAKRVWINDSFNNEVINLLSDFNWGHKPLSDAFEKINPIYDSFKKDNNLIIKKETEEDYEIRVIAELADSKRILEKNLNKKVQFLCWPHGDNNKFAHEAALKCGYLATTLGKYKGSFSPTNRIDNRIGTDALRNSVFLTTNRMLFNILVYQKKAPAYQLKKAYYFFKTSTN